VAYVQKKIQLFGFSANPDCSLSRFFRISGVLTYLKLAWPIPAWISKDMPHCWKKLKVPDVRKWAEDEHQWINNVDWQDVVLWSILNCCYEGCTLWPRPDSFWFLTQDNVMIRQTSRKKQRMVWDFGLLRRYWGSLRYNLYNGEQVPTFSRNFLPPSSEVSKERHIVLWLSSRFRWGVASKCCCLQRVQVKVETAHSCIAT
jgi:hypothetical protein